MLPNYDYSGARSGFPFTNSQAPDGQPEERLIAIDLAWFFAGLSSLSQFVPA
jgi:hypothetical protein